MFIVMQKQTNTSDTDAIINPNISIVFLDDFEKLTMDSMLAATDSVSVIVEKANKMCNQCGNIPPRYSERIFAPNSMNKQNGRLHRDIENANIERIITPLFLKSCCVDTISVSTLFSKLSEFISAVKLVPLNSTFIDCVSPF